jgi:hypothetical protein
LGPEGLSGLRKDGKIRLDEEVFIADGEEQGDCPVLKANIFSKLTFGWMTETMKLGSELFIPNLYILHRVI